jgi:hypothetical protein
LVFKDIAGEEAFVGLQTLVAGAGSGELQKLVDALKAQEVRRLLSLKKWLTTWWRSEKPRQRLGRISHSD